MAADLDPRRHAFRKDVADIALKNQVDAAQFVVPQKMQVRVPVLDLLSTPDATSIASQLLFGEIFDVVEDKEGWAWGKCRTDGYVGYVKSSGLGELVEANDVISTNLAQVYPRPEFKSVPTMILPRGALVKSIGETNEFIEIPEGFVSRQHVGTIAKDYVTEATRFLGVSYLWGGRSALGLDCSALVQIALAAAGQGCPRDSDMQLAELGTIVKDVYKRGDLIFWKGHVGIVFDEGTLLHANVHHMCVAFEPMSDAIARIANSDGPVVAHKRI